LGKIVLGGQNKFLGGQLPSQSPPWLCPWFEIIEN